MGLSDEDRRALMSLARCAVEAQVCGQLAPRASSLTGVLGEKRGCFVTLTNADELRGCIGTFTPRGPLAEMIVEMGRSAARDPRFVMNPITPAELAQLTVEVSVLSPLEKTDEPIALQIGKHGIYIVAGGASGCFLPEVATDMGWGPEEFLSHCCRSKAALPADAWRDPETTVYLFTSEKFDH